MEFLRNRLMTVPLPPPNFFHGKHILITGGNTGLGFASAVHCLDLGATSVVITSRSASKGAQAKKSIESQSSGTGIVMVLPLEMSFAGVETFAKLVKEEMPVVDFVLLNAGVLNVDGNVSGDGWENSLQVNVLSTVLLALLLLPWIKIAGKGEAHLTITGSGVHRYVHIDAKSGWPQQDVLKYFNAEEVFRKRGGQGMYDVSKLLVLYAMREISVLAKGKDGEPEVIVSAMCPGIVKTELARDLLKNPVLAFLMNPLLSVVMKPVDSGSRTLVNAALLNPEENGKYFAYYQSDDDYRATTEHNVWGPLGQEMQKKIWNEIVDVLGQQVSELKEIVRPIDTLG